jgi:uroporphyrinogen decarboxylase
MTTPLLVQALNRQPLVRPPVWLMRQAGRYLPEYRAVRAHFPDFVQFCLTPDAATQVTLQPVERFNLDAAIIFADILTIPHALGHTVTFTEGHGPHVQPITHPNQLAAMQNLLEQIPHRLTPVGQTIAQTRAALAADKAVIGFTGAPWTLACYLLDAKPSLGIPNTLAFAKQHPQEFQQLITLLTRACNAYLTMQAAHGADALQVFDSWALLCPPDLWQTAVHQPLLELSAATPLPTILFPRGATPAQLLALAESGATALSLSTGHNLAWAAETLQPLTTIQGNLDPALMTGPAGVLESALLTMLNTAAPRRGYIVNLGHGLTPDTNPDNVTLLMETVRNWRAPGSV